ncbi:DUF1624 domain-containing protein [Ferrimonas senticii]|uniref:DUF1624 domain-containing protein n=1 Tax=Ferrimonas senticii TaxID=394566 RepID=UPI0004166DC7|nr:heparan-alpha-glucosaminide N-acetyltransferase domain-containing protein [Ferrimonas senticii]
MTTQALGDTTAPITKVRLHSIDILRGLVMIIMLLDHVRERFFYHQLITDPMTIDATDPKLFFTRLIAHLCAPTFVLLTGLSAWLYANPSSGIGRSPVAFLIKRGLFLVLLEATLINFSWFGAYQTLYLQVIWAIGISMIALAVASLLPRWLIIALGTLIVAGHNALAPIQFQAGEWGYTLWSILHDRGFIFASDWLKIKASYPVLPWIGVILLGYGLGPLFSSKIAPALRQTRLLQLGMAAVSLLLLLRGFNIYGETLPWQNYGFSIQSLMSFLNYTKYPPSLDFVLLTLGIALPLLVVFERTSNRFTSYLQTYGSAPMFFYIVHLYLLLLMYKTAMAIWGGNQPNPYGEGLIFGVNHLWQIWVLTGVLAVLLYKPMQAFARYKHNSGNPWVKYL